MEIEQFFEDKELNESPNIQRIVPRNPWHQITITPQSSIFPLMQKVIQKIEPGQESITIKFINKDRSNKIREIVKDTYKFVFDWQSKYQYSVQVFRKGEDSYAETERAREDNGDV